MADTKETTKQMGDLAEFDNEFSTPLATDENIAQGDAPATIAVKSGATTTYKREIDLGDGSGKQVFEGKTPEELIDKLTEAQVNATKLIREQNLELRQRVRVQPEKDGPKLAAKPEGKALTADQKFAISLKLQNDPDAAFDELLQAKTGLSAAQLSDMAVAFNEMKYAKEVNEADVRFLTNHQADYLPTPDNAARIIKFLTDGSLPHTAQNLEYAYQELSESGLLTPMPEPENENPDTSQSQKDNKGDSKVVVAAHTRQKPSSTGLTSRNSSARVADKEDTKGDLTETEVEDIYALPLEQAKAKVLGLMRKASSSRG